MENTDIRGIIFDYGGTIDSRGDHWSEVIFEAYISSGLIVDKAAYRNAYVETERLFARQPIIVPEDTFLEVMHKKVNSQLDFLARDSVVTPAQVETHAAQIANTCYQSAALCVAQAKPVLTALAKRFPMVLVSNFYGNISSVLADFGLTRFFPAVIESAVVGVRKPDPAIFALGVDALALPAHQVLVVGDSYRKDILPARSLGCQTAWLKGRGWTEEEDRQTDPAQIQSLNDLLKICHCGQ